MDNKTTVERKLSAIAVTDIAEFTSLSGKDEMHSIEILKKQKVIINSLADKYNGKLHKEMGDGLLFTFPTVTEAIRFSIEFQNAVKNIEDLNLRIGLHEGEINFIENDIIGDDVNITYRIESLSPIGGVAISGKIQQNISSLAEFETEFIGVPDLKGVSKNVEVHCIISHSLARPAGKIKRKSKALTFSAIAVFMAISLIGMLFPVFKNSNPSATTNTFNSNESDYLEPSIHSKEILNDFAILNSFLEKNDLDNNFEAYNIIDQLLITSPSEGDFLAYKGIVLHQRYTLSNDSKHLDNAILSLKLAIESKNLNVDKLTQALFTLATIEYERENPKEAYSYSKRAYKINKKYPGLQEIHKKINRKRL